MNRRPPAPPDGRPSAGMAGLSPAVVVIVSGMVAALHVGKMPPAIPVLKDTLGVTLVEAGFLLSMVQLAGMLGGVLIGLAADGAGLRRSLLAGQALLAVASLCGLAVTRPAELMALRAVEGCGFLLAVLPVPSLLRQLVPPQRLALHLGLWGTYMPAGTATALAVGPVVIGAVGWSGLWAGLAVASALSAVWIVARVPSDGMRRAAATAVADASAGRPAAAWQTRLSATLGSPGPWRVATTFAMYSGQWLAVIGFLPAIYAQAGVPAALAAPLTAFACVANVAGNLAAGRLMHRGVAPRRLLEAGFAAMAVTTFVAFGPFVIDAATVHYAAVVLFSALGGLIPATLFAQAVRVAPSEQTVSTTVGWMQQCSSAGQFLGPPLVAWLAAASGGWHRTWWITGMASVVGLLLARRAR